MATCGRMNTLFDQGERTVQIDIWPLSAEDDPQQTRGKNDEVIHLMDS
jgi:hypothetical protein